MNEITLYTAESFASCYFIQRAFPQDSAFFFFPPPSAQHRVVIIDGLTDIKYQQKANWQLSEVQYLPG